MSNILVTTPKNEITNSKREGEEAIYWFRTFRFKPAVNIGDKIYFVENNIIVGYGIIFEIQQIKKSEHCDITDRKWGKRGDWVIKYKDWNWLKKKIKFLAFQGLRYIDNNDYLKANLK